MDFGGDINELFFQEEEDNEPEFPFVEVNGFRLRLPNHHHTLWGDLVWHAGRIVSEEIAKTPEWFDVRGKTVVEFGAGAGLCTLTAAKAGALLVVTTDYPDQILLDNLRYNTENIPNIKLVGHKWGTDPTPVLEANGGKQFDCAILCDLVFNIVCHKDLLASLKAMLSPDGVALVSYTHHRVRYADQDMNFFRMAESDYGFQVEELFTRKHKPMFENDLGDVEIRSTCHVCLLRFRH